MKVVMLIDDEPAILELLELFLEDIGCQIISFTSPEEAYTTIKNFRHVDLVISDINMPSMNGIELLKLVRELPNDVKWIFCSAFLEEKKQLIEDLSLNVSGYYAKPIQSQELNLLVRESIN